MNLSLIIFILSQGVVKKPDGASSISGETITLSANTNFGMYFEASNPAQAIKSNHWQMNVTTDKNGVFLFTLPPVLGNTSSFMVYVRIYLSAKKQEKIKNPNSFFSQITLLYRLALDFFA